MRTKSERIQIKLWNEGLITSDQPKEALIQIHNEIRIRKWPFDVELFLSRQRGFGKKSVAAALEWLGVDSQLKENLERKRRAKEISEEVATLTADDWTVEDWADLHNAIEGVKARVAMRHGLKGKI